MLRRLAALATSGVLLFGVVAPLTPAVRATDQSGDVSGEDVAKTPNGDVTEAKPAPITTPAGGGGASADPTVGGAPLFLPYTPPAATSEVPDDRTRQTRTLANPDGSFTLEASDGPINFQDQAGAWQPIDLSLVPDGEGGYKVAANAGDIRLDSTDGSIGSIAIDGHKVSLSAPGYASGTLGTALDVNKVTYTDALGTAAEVWVQPTDTGLEFGAAWADATLSPVVSFVLDPGDLAAALDKDGRTVLFSDASGKFAGMIGQPFIREGDPDGPPLVDVVSVALVPLGDKTYLLSYTLDEKWLANPERVFPVLLDPDLCIGAGVSGCTSGSYDTFVFNHDPDLWESGWTTIRTGYDVRSDDGDTYGKMRSILYFPQAGLPDGAVIYDTDLQAKVCCNYGSGQGQTIYADLLTKKLTSHYTWNKYAAAFDPVDRASAVVPAAGSNMHWDVDKIVTAWYTRRPQVNSAVYGILLQMASEDSSHGEVEFRRSTNGTVSNRPLLTIHYTLPAVGIDFDPRLGPTYAPSSMVVGIPTKLPIRVTNKTGSAHVLSKCTAGDTDCWKVGYRWFDGKGNVVAGGTDTELTDLPADIAIGATSSLFPISVTPPPSTGQYTLTLDAVHYYTNTRGWASDFASPSLYYSRNKNVLTADSTRWTGSSLIERDEFSINVTEGVGAGPVHTVTDGAGGVLGIDLVSKNLSYAGDTGLGFADRSPLSLTYGFNEAPLCAGYLGILGACGWYTNWDERIVGGSNQTGFDYTYYGPDGTPAMVDSDLDGQLIGGASVLLNRQRVTMLDENGGWDGPDAGTTPDIPAVASGDGGITAFAGAYMAKLSSDVSLDVNQPDKVSLNAYRKVRFAIRATVAAKSALCFWIDNLTDSTISNQWYCLTVGSADWSTGEYQKFYSTGTIQGAWRYVNEDLYDDVRPIVAFGGPKDDYQVLKVEVRTAGATGGSTYLDAFRFESDETVLLDDTTSPTWSAGTSITTTDRYVGATSTRVSPAGTTISPKCDTSTACWSAGSGGTWAYPFFDWYWKKVGGTSAAFLFFLNDYETGTDCTLTYYTGAMPKLASLPSCNAMIRIDDTLPTTWTRVRRNVSEDARQALGLYDASGDGTGDNIRVTGWAPLAIDGGWLLIDQLSYGNLADVAAVDPTNAAGALAGEKGHPSAAGDTAFTYDFSADYADGSRHYFNRDGLLIRIRTRDGQSTSLDWSFNLTLSGAAAYSLTAIHAPGDGTTSGATTFERQFTVTYGTDGTSSTVRFDEDLGKTGADSSDRAVIFERTTGKDLIRVSPARNHTAVVGPNGTFCGTRPNGCVEFSYLSGHLLQFVADPRWDGSTSGANNYRLEIVHAGSDPMSIKDDSHGGATLLNILAYNDPGTGSPVLLYLRPQWQDAAAAAANSAIATDINPDGRTLTEYTPRSCVGTCSTLNSTWPTSTAQGDYKTVDYLFDGLSRVNSVITYRCPKASTAVSGCTGSTYLLTETRSETNAGAKVDNYADPLAAGRLVWRASADQVFASLRDSNGRNTDLYRTEYRYDGFGQVAETIEVRQLETSTSADTVKINSPYAYWRLNETSGTSMADSSGSGRSGTYTVAPTLGGFGAVVRDAANKAPTFNGSTQYAKATNAQMGSVTGTFTVEGWVRSTSGTTSQTFVGSRGPSNYGFDVKLCPDTCTGGRGVRFDVGSGTAWLFSTTVPFDWVAGPWYYIAVVVDGTADTAKVYVDGQLAGGGPFTTAGTPVLTNSTHDLYVGQTGLASFNEWFAGQIDELAVYTSALPAADIARHYRAGRGIATVDTTVIHDNAGHPTETASSFMIDPGFEQMGTGWSLGTGASIDTAAANANTGYGSLKTATVGTQQVVQLVPGQTFRLQFATTTSAGTTPVHVKLQSGNPGNTWTTLNGLDTDYTNTSWTTRAFDVTLPMTTDGRVRVSFTQTGAGVGRVDDVVIVTHWATVAYSGTTGIGYGLATDGYGLAACQGGPCTTATIRTQFRYAAGTTGPDYYPAILPTTVIANYGNSVPGPNPDDDVTTLTTFDSWGRRLTAVDPDGVVSTTIYDATNKSDVAQLKDGLNNATAMTYDKVGNVLTTTSPLGRVMTSVFDVRNHQVSSTGPDGVKSQTDYDNYGQATASWSNYVDGNPTNGDGSDDLLSTQSYDAFGNVIQQDVECGSVATCATGGLDARTTSTYDLLGNVVASTSKPGAGGTGTARTTTNYFETVVVGSATYSATKASGVRLPIAPSSGPAPVCPGSSAFCNSVTTLDLSGRGIAATDAYGIVTRTALDLDGHAVRTIAGYVDGTPGPGADADVTTTAQYNLAGDAYLTKDAATRRVSRTFDALGRNLTVDHQDTGGTSFLVESTAYLPSGRVDRASDGSAWTRTAYDGAGRAIRTIANYDTGGNAGMTVDAIESGEPAETGSSGIWKTSTTGVFVLAAPAALTTDGDAAGNAYSQVAPVSGRGRLHVTTSSGSASSGTWFDLSGPTYQSGHTYKAAFDLMADSASLSLTAYLGQDQGGGSYGTLAISSTTSWTRYTVSWTAGSNLSSLIHFAIAKAAAGTAQLYLDNLVVWDTTVPDRGIVSSVSGYDADGEVIASVLPPGDPATERPLVTTVAFDPAGRTVQSVTNGSSGAYAASILGTGTLAAYFPLGERVGQTAADKAGGGALSIPATLTIGVAGGIDEARTGVRLTGANGYLSRTSNATSNTTNVSMEAWIRTDSTPASTVIVAANGSSANGWGIGIDSAGKAAGFTLSGSTFTTMPSPVTVTDGAWHHLVLTRGASTWAMTIDGAAQTLTSNTTNPGTPAASFTIGALSDGSRPYVGEIDEVSAYTTDISGATATAHWAAGRRSDTTTALTTRNAYDRLGRVIDAWAPDLVRTKATYDRLGNQTQTIANYRDGLTTGGTADDDVISTFAYDVLGELIGYCPAVEVKFGGCDPASGSEVQAWHYGFDAMGRQTTTIAPDNTAVSDLTTEEVVYEPGGRVAKTCRYPAGTSCGSVNSRHTDFTYDNLGRILTQKTWDRGAGSDTLKFTKTLTWNADGSPATVSEGTDTLTYAYDTAGRLSAFKRGATVLTGYTYTAGTSTIATRTDGTQGSTAFTYDWARRQTVIDPPDAFVAGTVTRSYRLDGLLATQGFPSSITETLAYDEAKRPTSIALGGSDSISQAFDRAGRVTSDGRSLAGITGDAGTGTQSFTYDALSRLTGSTGLAVARSYQYDLDGNRTQKVEGAVTTDYTYDRADQVKDQTIGVTTRTYDYDRYGNLLTSADNTNAVTTYAYDEASRLTTISPPGGATTQVTFTLDALDRHATRLVNAGLTDTYQYLDATETAWQTGTATTSSLLDADGSRLAVKTGGTVSWLLFDLHGSVVAMCTSGTSTITDAYRFDGFGQEIASSGTATNPWRYRGLLNIGGGALADALLDMGARDYSPQLGQFTQADSVQGSAANPMTMNRFLYALANPATLVDPDGHNACLEDDSGRCMPSKDINQQVAENQRKARAYHPVPPPHGTAPPEGDGPSGVSGDRASNGPQPPNILGFNLPDPSNVHTTGGCGIFSFAVGAYVTSIVCDVTDANGRRGILISNGKGYELGLGFLVNGGVLYSNGMDIQDQSGHFDEFGFTPSVWVAGGGFTTASGTSANGQGINTTIVQAGPAAGLGPGIFAGSSETVVIPYEDAPWIVRELLGSSGPSGAGAGGGF